MTGETTRVPPQLGAAAGKLGTARRIVVAVVAAWILVATLILLVARLPSAVATGHLERQGAAFQPYLAAGWYPLELYTRSAVPGHKVEQIAANLSDSARSSLRVPSDWTAARLLLQGFSCPSGAAQEVTVSAQRAITTRLRLSAAWTWYSVRLRSPGRGSPQGPLSGPRSVTLTYGCPLHVALGGLGLSAHVLAISIGGVEQAR